MNILEHMLAQNVFRAERSGDKERIELAHDLMAVAMRYWDKALEAGVVDPGDTDPMMGPINDKWGRRPGGAFAR
jgi:hypothetical protein